MTSLPYLANGGQAAVFFRTCAEFLAEQANKILYIFITYVFGNLVNLLRGMQQQSCRRLHAGLGNVLVDGHTRMRFEKVAKIRRIEIKLHGQRA